MLYEVYWSWYEEYNPIQLTSQKEYTEEEFKRLCDHLLIRVLEKHVEEQEEGWIGFSSNILEEVVDTLMYEYGFAEVNKTSTGWFGGYILDDEDDFEGFEFIPKELRDKIIKRNVEVRKKMMERLD